MWELVYNMVRKYFDGFNPNSRTHRISFYHLCPNTYKIKNILAHYIYMHPFKTVIINSSKTNQFATHNKLLRKATTNELRYVFNSNAQNTKFHNSQIWYHVQWISDELTDPFSDVGVITRAQEFLVRRHNELHKPEHLTQTQLLSTNHGHHEPANHWCHVT